MCRMNARSAFLTGAALASAVAGIITYLPYLPPRIIAQLPKPVTCNNGAPPIWLNSVLELSQELAFPGFEIAYSDGVTKNSCAAGWTHANGLFTPLKIDQRFRFASLSKIMTSAVIAQLYEEGKLTPDDRIVEILGIQPPFSDPRVANISINQLLNHRAGFDRQRSGDSMTSDNPWCPKKISHLRTMKLDFRPGDLFSYSNVGYCLLGAAIARIEGGSLERSIRARLLTPNRLSDTIPTTIRRFDGREAGYFFGAGDSEAELLQLDYESMVASGGWSGTAENMLAILQLRSDHSNYSARKVFDHSAIESEKECNEKIWRGCHDNALYRYKESNGTVMHWRDGSLPGLSAFAAIFDDGKAVVFLANSRAYDWMPQNDRLGKTIYAIFTQ